MTDKDAACYKVHNSTERYHTPSHIHLFNKDVKIFIPGPVANPNPVKRNSITVFSYSSCRRLLFVCRNSGQKIKSQISLTYHNKYPLDGQEVKKHLNTFLTSLRRKYPGINYLWVLEFQLRGAPHIHLFTDQKKKNKIFQRFVAQTWKRIVDPENQKLLKVHLHPKNFISWKMKDGKYLVKEYLAKSEQKHVPKEFQNVGRFWGNSKGMRPVPSVLDPSEIPEYILTYAIRNSSKRYEKIVSYLKKRKYKVRGRHLSYALPGLSGLFVSLLEYYGAFGPTSEMVLF